ncbi:MAG TPA: methyltransferase [Gaiellaceae bacterium]|nr:methyltransferase [Gaiellaceae bacterium]
MSRAPEEILWDFLRGAMMTKALGIVADLRIAEALADGPRAVDQLARDADVDADVLHRLLRALASDGVFEEREPGTFAMNAGSEPLLQPSWSAFAHLFGDVFYTAIADLDDAARTGAATFPDAFGTGFWPWLADHPGERALFDRAMSGERRANADRLAELDWADGDVVVDIGGGSGALLSDLLRRRPGLRGIVLDLPETVRDEEALGPDIEFVAGSFFETVPAGDAYVLSGIIHDWDDEAATAILRTVRAAAPPGARVLITETVIQPGNEPAGAKWLDLLMLVLAGGRERTEQQWRALLEGAGLEPVRIESGLIEARCR